MVIESSKLDRIDLQVLEALQLDARISMQELADRGLHLRSSQPDITPN